MKWYKNHFFRFVDILIDKNSSLGKKERDVTWRLFQEGLANCRQSRGTLQARTQARASEASGRSHCRRKRVGGYGTSQISPITRAAKGRKLCVHCKADRTI
ncbi:hypothetical protein AAFF_G00377720 [Aldrovandia affinis]|uniref:Uncharacterized protein n=1 Tax=Aldrovandia affinis TaxID=143900 RepID=A0AAD7WLU5_9TELE|nr:hypothetical protein AAFF_G00377720 [Aldrovandia affinis]